MVETRQLVRYVDPYAIRMLAGDKEAGGRGPIYDQTYLCSAVLHDPFDDNQITLFKSVGHALEDLAAATYYYSKFQK